MEDKTKILTWDEFVNSDIDTRDYEFADFEGTFSATLVCKRWGKKDNVIAYFLLDDGRKISAMAWKDTRYMGLKNIETGESVTVTFERTKNGYCRLAKVESAGAETEESEI